MKRACLRPISAKKRRADAELRKSVTFIRNRSHDLCEAQWTIARYERSLRLPGGGEHPHHILPRSQGGTHDPSNLLWVSAVAHRWIHENPEQSYRLGLLKRRKEL